jgi:2,5-dichlorohydroquinone reductive dechlorinase
MALDTPADLSELTRSARLAAVGDPARRTIVTAGDRYAIMPRDEASAAPELELFHFVMSVCSQKCRTALIHAGLSFAGSELVIMPPLNENYVPEYVRLRMTSPLAKSTRLVGSYSGASDVAHEGFDPLVVPTLVDFSTGEIVTDSREICLHADHRGGGTLVPSDLADAVQEQVALVDSLPHPALLYGTNPDGDRRPGMIQEGTRNLHLRKIEQVRRRMAELPEGSPLTLAYEHKILKEEAGRAFVSDPAKMRSVIGKTHALVMGLDRRLADSGNDWAAGDRFTLADIYWAVSLFRLLFLGYDWMWEKSPAVTAYSHRVFAVPSVRRGVIDWPGHPPSDRIAPYQARG